MRFFLRMRLPAIAATLFLAVAGLAQADIDTLEADAGPQAAEQLLATEQNKLVVDNEVSAPVNVVPEVVPERPVADVLEGIRQRFEERFPGVQISGVQATPMSHVYEVQVGMDIVYTDEGVDHVIQGALIDAHSLEDLTAERLHKLAEVELESLPLDLAVKQVKGTGARKIAVFEDPNCGYCRELHKTLEGVDDITIYTLLYPILSPDSVVKSRNIWCADNPVAAWRAWMLERQEPASANCEAPIDEVLDLGRQLQVRGTPAIIFSDGERVNGAMPLDSLLARLEEAEEVKKQMTRSE